MLKRVAEIFANALDRTSAEKRLQASLKEKEALLKEIHHRVKNNMQIVDSLLYLQARAIENQVDPVALDAFSKSESRIKSMASILDRLYRSRDLSNIDCREYLRALVPELLDFYGVEDRISAHIESEPLLLEIDQAIPCGLMVNEFLTNSFKHGFPNGRSGTIRIELHRMPDDERKLSVIDDGVGIPQGQDWSRPESLGLRLVRDLTRQLDGRISMESEGGRHPRTHRFREQAKS